MRCDPSRQTLAALNLSKRAINAFARGGIRTLADAEEWTDEALLTLPDVGHAAVAALRAAQQQDGEL